MIYSINCYIQVGYSGQSDIVARKGWPKVATISEVHCTYSKVCSNKINQCICFIMAIAKYLSLSLVDITIKKTK